VQRRGALADVPALHERLLASIALACMLINPPSTGSVTPLM
jgi:hypothetical protein